VSDGERLLNIPCRLDSLAARWAGRSALAAVPAANGFGMNCRCSLQQVRIVAADEDQCDVFIRENGY
jgi:hypothetical protein